MLDLPKMPVSRNSGSNHCKKGEIIKSLDLFLQEIDEGAWTVISSATDYPENWVIPEHSHEKHQLLYAIEGVMVVHSAHNQWTVPPNRGFWMPCGHRHSLRCVGPLKMRSVFVRPDSFPNLPWSKAMLGVQSLLVALPTLRASFLLRPHGKSLSIGAVQLRYVLLAHGVFYVAKALSVLIPGTLIDLAAFKGEIIQISLVEGAMAIMLIALSMTGSERYRREQQIARLAARDPLTALYNRRALDLRAPRLLAQVSPSQPGALLLIDIDNFKGVNDHHGHTSGDRLLIALSEMIRSLVPQGALAARLGGDEFVILLNPVSKEQVIELGSDLREQFQQLAAQTFATPERVTLSIGANLFDQPPPSLAALIEQGDTTLYESKRGGRDSIRLVDRTGVGTYR